MGFAICLLFGCRVVFLLVVLALWLTVNNVGIVRLTFMCLLLVFLVFDLDVAYVC